MPLYLQQQLHTTVHRGSWVPALTLWQAALNSSGVHSGSPAGHASVRLCQHLPHSAAELPGCTHKHTSVSRLPTVQQCGILVSGGPQPYSQV